MSKFCAILKRIDGYLGLAVFIALAIYALGMSRAYVNTRFYEDTISFYQQIQPINDMVIFFAIFGIAWSALYKVLRNDIRKIYYTSNFIWHGVYLIYSFAAGIACLLGIASYQARYYSLDFAAINHYFSDVVQMPYRLNPQTPVFLIGYSLCALVLLSGVLVGICGFYHLFARIRYEKGRKASGARARSF